MIDTQIAQYADAHGHLPSVAELQRVAGLKRQAAREALQEYRAKNPNATPHPKDTTNRVAAAQTEPYTPPTSPDGVDWDTDETARWEKSETQSRLYVRPRAEAAGVSVPDLIEQVIDRKLQGIQFPRILITPPRTPAQLVTGTLDLHLAKRDVDAGWTVDRARTHAQQAMEDIEAQAADMGRNWRTVLIVGSDAIHTANGWTTTKGTLQHATAQTGAEVEALIDLTCVQIELYAPRGPVHLLGVSGNHGRDPETAALIGIKKLVERGVFGQHVTVGQIAGNRAATSDYWEPGRVLTFCRHGDDIPVGKPELLALEMARHPDWTRAQFRDFHLGHLHTLARKGVKHISGMGFEVITHPALGGPDEWHSRHLYYGAARMAVGVLYRPGRRTILESYRLTEGEAV